MTTSAERLFQTCDPEIWILTARSKQRQSGLVATYVTRASITERPRIMIGLAHHHFTQALIAESGVFCAHLITEKEIEWVWRFGTESGETRDKMRGLSTSCSEGSAPILSDAAGWIECRVEDSLDAGDRVWYLADVVSAHCERGFVPLTVGRVLELADDTMQQKLQSQLFEDATLDQQAIDHWRRNRQSPSVEFRTT